MPSSLYDNDAIEFICARNFVYNGNEYSIGDDFDQEDARYGNIETLVRTRHVIPVVDSLEDKPRHWYREIKLREDVLAKLDTHENLLTGPADVQLVLGPEESTPITEELEEPAPTPEPLPVPEQEQEEVEETEPVVPEPDEPILDLEENELTEPGPVPGPTPVDPKTGQPEGVEPEPADEDYDPSEHTVLEVKSYVDAHPEERENILADEEAGKNRSTLTSYLSEE